MANICLYKIKIQGSQTACYKFIDMMPAYNRDKDILFEEGTDDNYTLIMIGDCKWSVSAYTNKMENPQPFTNDELNAIEDGDHWDKTLRDKSVLLNCEIWCNSKDIDESSWAIYEHYNRGAVIRDECPKELHIKRGRDYDNYGTVVFNISPAPTRGRLCKILFASGYNYYQGEFVVGDIIRSSGKDTGTLGRIISIEDDTFVDGKHKIHQIVGHATPYVEEDMEAIWKSRKPKERKEWLATMGMDSDITKVKFLRLMNHQWTLTAFANQDWDSFKTNVQSGTYHFE